jgi:hypothetical protein
MKLELFAIFLFYILINESAFSQNKEFLPKDYEKNYFEYSETEDLKPRRNNFKWINKIGFDSIAVEAGINDVYVIPHKHTPCGINCDYRILIKEYQILDFHFGLSSIDFLTQNIFLNKGLLIIRRNYAYDYFAIYRNKYGYDKWSNLKFQVPLQLGLKLSNFHLSSGINIQFLEVRKYVRKEDKNNLLQKDISFRFRIAPSARFNYIKKFKSFTAGVYIGADLNYKYSLYRKVGFVYFIR